MEVTLPIISGQFNNSLINSLNIFNFDGFLFFKKAKSVLHKPKSSFGIDHLLLRTSLLDSKVTFFFCLRTFYIIKAFLSPFLTILLLILMSPYNKVYKVRTPKHKNDESGEKGP